jgi:large subunit ribosomal protein L5
MAKVLSMKEKAVAAYPIMKKEFGYTNPMQAPKLEKVLVSIGTGKNGRGDKKRGEFIVSRLATITGQKASPRKAKKSIATFKLREGEIIGQLVTMRGARMNAFLDKYLNIAIPRTKDFRGFSVKSIDAMGNVTFGIKEHTVFPECADENLADVFGMAITIVTTCKTKAEAEAFLTNLGFPFRPEAELATRRGLKRMKKGGATNITRGGKKK